MIPTPLTQRILYTYNLMRAARRSGDVAAERQYTRRLDELLERVPRPARF